MATPSGANAEIVGVYLDAVLRKDRTAIDRFFHPDVEYVVSGSPVRTGERRLPSLSR